MIFAFGDFELHEHTRELRRRGELVALEPRVFDLLSCLVRNRARLVSRSELLDIVWGGVVVGDAAVSRAVREARRVLGDDGDVQRFIKTSHARGFRFVASVVERADEEAAAPAPVTAPAAADDAARDDFVGRGEALARFTSLLADATAKRGATLLVVGEAGIGKTRVLEKFAEEASRAGASVRFARCSEADGVPALWPFEQIVRGELAEIEDATSLAPLQRDAISGVATLAPDAVARLGIAPAPSADGPEGRFRLFAGVIRWLTLPSPRPRVFIVDDLHLADAASLALVHELAPFIRSAPVVLVAAMRDQTGETLPPLARAADALARRTARGTLRLEGLSADDVAQLARFHATGELSPAAIENLTKRTGGNPLFLSHLLAFVDGDDDVEGPESVRMPAALRDALERSLDALSEECVRALSFASVIGTSFSVAVLSAASGVRADALLDAIGEAAMHGVVRRARGGVDGYELVHGLLRDVLYARISLGERARMHAAVGDALLRAHAASDQAEELAHHFIRAASAGRTEDAVLYATLAADRAVARAAYEHAAGLYSAALEVLTFAPNADRRAQLLVRLGTALGRDGRLAEAGAAFRGAADRPVAARADGDAELDVHVLRESFYRIIDRTPTATVRFYEILFDRHPEARPLFRRNAAPVQAKMMNDTLMAIIDRLEDAPWLKSSLAALGVKHVEYGITEPMYAWVGGSLLAALAEAAGDIWTPRVARAWADAYAAISRMMIDGARMALTQRAG